MYIHRDGEYEPITRTPPSFTNADRIRSMKDEELAEFLWKYAGIGVCPPITCPATEKCWAEKCWGYWLKEKAKDD